MDDRSVLERIASAKASHNLQLKRTTGDIDYIIALGMAAMQVNRAASAMLNLHLAQDPASYREARSATQAIAKHLNMKKRWKLKVRDMIQVADIALKHYVCPVCPECYGRGFDLVPGSNRLSANPCRPCHGTGKKPLPLHRRTEIAGILASLEHITIAAEESVRRRVHGYRA